MQLSFSELTPLQVATICNGCGGKGGVINPPNFLFKASCDHHDYKYYIGGTEDDRLKADEAFYRAMKVDCKNGKWYLYPYNNAICYIYFKAVRVFGKEFFNYKDQEK